MANAADRLRALADLTDASLSVGDVLQLAHDAERIPGVFRGYADALDALAELTHYPCTHQAWTPEKLSEVIALCRKCQARAVLAEAGRLLGDNKGE